MLETVDRAIKRSTNKSKLSQLKRIKKQLEKNRKICEKNLSNMNQLKNYLEGYRPTLKVFCLQKKI